MVARLNEWLAGAGEFSDYRKVPRDQALELSSAQRDRDKVHEHSQKQDYGSHLSGANAGLVRRPVPHEKE